MMRERAIALLSGGLDSSVATELLAEKYEIVCALTVDYNQKAAQKEIEAACALCWRLGIEHRVIAQPWLGEITSTALVSRTADIPMTTEQTVDDKAQASVRAEAVWVPNRNGLFANMAASFADAFKADAIIVGFNAEEAATFSDNSIACADALTKSFSFSTLAKPRIVAPTAGLRKEEIATIAARRDIVEFWSCYLGGEKMCGACESCVRAARAFRAAGMFEMIQNKFFSSRE
jgi:7-cyano-7-deazaguanine synthase